MDYEKLGLFYLGKKLGPDGRSLTDELVLYDSRHLLTHAVVVGMTGSGKTGLCIDMLEEAALDGVPVIAIDPKGDISNLLLTFPGLEAAEFAPYVDEHEAARKGMTREAYAESVAATWERGLASFGMDGRRIEALRASADVAVYTPGSQAGLPLSVLRSLAAPGAAVREDPELLRESISSTVTSLLGLVGIDADPMQSREHILLSALVDRAFRAGRSLDLPTLIHETQTPPFEKVGVLDLESFYPASARFGLVMALNNLVASPSFEAFSAGEPLDIARLLRTDGGRPRVSILSIAHLDDAQRMFFVTLVLNQVLAWTRAQSGTSALRAIVYMDEIFGYFPPVANPPSKKPLLTLLKQARAFGVGVVLATQNPVDLDYKGLSNTGTWFLGRLQTERDKQRVLEGLEGAASTQGTPFDRAQMERTLAGLSSRRFVMNDVHADAPIVFETRWAMSYLRGPLTRAEIKPLMDARKAASAGGPLPEPPAPVAAGAASVAGQASVVGAAVGAGAAHASAAPSGSRAAVRPTLAPEVPQCFLPLRRGVPAGASLLYRPMLLGLAKVAMTDVKAGVDTVENLALLTPITDHAVPVHWEAAEPLTIAVPELAKQPADVAGAQFHALAPAAAIPKKYAAWSKELASHLFATRRLELARCPSTKLVARVGEDAASFRGRLAHAARERRDAEIEKLRSFYAPKVARIDERIRKGYATIERERAQAEEATIGSAFSMGSAVLSALTGRRAVSATSLGRAGAAARGARRRGKERGDIAVAEAAVRALLAEREALEARFKAEVEALNAPTNGAEALETLVVKPKKAGITVVHLTLAWAPYAAGHAEAAEPLFVAPRPSV